MTNVSVEIVDVIEPKMYHACSVCTKDKEQGNGYCKEHESPDISTELCASATLLVHDWDPNDEDALPAAFELKVHTSVLLLIAPTATRNLMQRMDANILTEVEGKVFQFELIVDEHSYTALHLVDWYQDESE